MTEHEIHAVLPYAVNSAIFFVLVFILFRKPTIKFLYQRHEHMKDQIEAAGKAFAVAADRNARAKSSMGAIASEEATLIQKEKVDAAKEKAEIIEKAGAEAKRMAAESDRLAEGESSDAAAKLRKEFLTMLVASAELGLSKNLKQNDHDEIVKHARTSIEAGV